MNLPCSTLRLSSSKKVQQLIMTHSSCSGCSNSERRQVQWRSTQEVEAGVNHLFLPVAYFRKWPLWVLKTGRLWLFRLEDVSSICYTTVSSDRVVWLDDSQPTVNNSTGTFNLHVLNITLVIYLKCQNKPKCDVKGTCRSQCSCM